MIKINKHIFLLSIIALMLNTSVHSFADAIDLVCVADFDSSVIEVSGQLEETDKERQTAIVFEKASSDINDTIEGDYLKADEMFVKEFTVPASGKYSYSFVYKGKTGEYNVYVTDSEKKYGPFIFCTKSEITTFLNDVAEKQILKVDMFNKVKYYSGSVGYDISFAQNGIVQNYIADNITTLFGDEKISIEKNNFNSRKEYFISCINTIKKEFEFVEKLKNTTTSVDVNKLLNDDADIVILTKYNTLSDNIKSTICTEFIRKNYTYFKDFKLVFDKYTDNPPKINSKNESSGGGGGGGSIGGAKPIQQTTVNTPQNEVQNTDKFSDLKDYEWAKEAIEKMSDKNIINGVQKGLFCPEQNVTREQLAKIIIIAYGLYDKNNECEFNDVPKENWAYSYIASAKKSGIMTGISETKFGLSINITREDLALVLYRASLLNNAVYNNTKTDFIDFDSISDYAKEAVSYLAGAGIINGYENRFNPKAYATRAEAAQLVYSIIGGE